MLQIPPRLGEEFRNLLTRRLTANFLLSYGMFLTFMLLDMVTTTLLANGDWSQEGNAIARFWYENTGVFAVLEIPLWSLGVLVLGFIILMKSEFLALWYINGMAFGHLLGWLTWTEYYVHVYNLLGAIAPSSIAYVIPLGVYGLLFGIFPALLQHHVSKHLAVTS